MASQLDHFPVFEANQVLTSGHLNDVFTFLDQQERRTRTLLVGVGIVCGLEFQLSGGAIALSKGCGVTSEGYLAALVEDVSLVAYRPYTPPADLDYPPFRKGAGFIGLFELFAAGEPNVTPLTTPAGFLDDKVLLLFVELNKQGLRNCSPNNCDDKGAQVAVTLRPLLIAAQDLDAIIAAGAALGGGLSGADLDAALSARLNLPDLRLRRFDVPDSNPATSQNVYAAFLDMIRKDHLAQATGAALSSAYAAFKPLLAARFPSDPFGGFAAAYGFLDSAPTDPAQVRFLQYYVDFFDDLLRAYDEFRWKALDLLCGCCPDEGMFPRHLMLGALTPAKLASPAKYRQGFSPSPATGNCAAEAAEVVALFARLVEMAARFTNAPTLPPANATLDVDPQIRVTPSGQGACCDRLETRAIPYYYAQAGATPLYRLWSPTLTRRGRAQCNYSYNADLYANPAAPAFVADPLRHDFAPRDFLRIEGHIGKDYRVALKSLLTLRNETRLPIDIVALRTGAYDPRQPVDLSKEGARFQDLDALYETLRGDLMTDLAEGTMQLYDRAIPAVPGLALPGGVPQLPLLKQYAPHYAYGANTIGAWYEHYLNRFTSLGYIDVNQDAIDANAVLQVYCVLFNGVTAPEPAAQPDVVALFYIAKLWDIVTPTLPALNFPDFQNKYQDLMALIRFLRSQAAAQVTPDLKNFLPEEEFIDLCEGLLFSCKLEAIKALSDEYVARVTQLRKRQFLSDFLQNDPGVRHGAGAPLGGAFILVYHGGAPAASASEVMFNIGAAQQILAVSATTELALADTASGAARRTAATASAKKTVFSASESARLEKAIGAISANRTLLANDDVNFLVNILGRRGPGLGGGRGGQGAADPAAAIIDKTVSALADGVVIADFFLPYPLASGLPGMQFTLPKPSPSFTLSVGCANANGEAATTVNAKGGVPPYQVAVDDGDFVALDGTITLKTGEHTIKLRDADLTEAPSQKTTVAPPLVIGAPSYACKDGNYVATAAVSGGAPPYQVDGKALENAAIVTDPTPSGAKVSVKVVDSMGCSATADFQHTCPPPCTLPCAGVALKRNFRFFLAEPDPSRDKVYQAFKLVKAQFTVDSEPGKTIDLSAKVTEILQATPADLAQARFKALVASWLKKINGLIAATPELAQAGKAQWLTLDYQSVAPGVPGVLTIEYFECLSFAINIELSFTLGGAAQSLQISYTPAGTLIRTADQKFEIPAFDGVRTDKCAETPQPADICPVRPEFSVKIERAPAAPPPIIRGGAAPFSFKVSASVDPGQLKFLWEAQDGQPAMGNDSSFSTSFSSSGAKIVKVTGFDDKGCSASDSMTINAG